MDSNRGNRDSKPRRNDRSDRGNSSRGRRESGNRNDNAKRKRVSFEDEFEKGNLTISCYLLNK